MHHAHRLAVVCLLALTGLVGLPAAGAAADEGDGWSLAPSSGSGGRAAGDGRPAFYMEGGPGTVLQDTVTVTNPDSKPLTVRLRAAEAYNEEDGSFAVGESRDGRGPQSWLSLADDEVRIPPRTRAEIPFTVAVPGGATPGDHPAALIAEAAGRKAGVRVHLRVSGPSLSAVTVEDVTIDGDSISYALVNRGNTVLTPKLAVHAEGLFGEVLDRAARPLDVELLPGRKVSLREPWSERPAFDAVRVELTVSAEGAAQDSAGADIRLVPWTGVLGGAALAAGCTALAVFTVRRRRAIAGFAAELQQPEERPVPVPVPVSAGAGVSGNRGDSAGSADSADSAQQGPQGRGK
ncbi:hypothetical protein [Streptomyces sp. KLOTTS4A1]|uniref:COG1470 family protein n=1 Tax=Streptomyces sp. KLOTTS4A1 TaxID=3390996 RepID=UPI0039F4FDFF